MSVRNILIVEDEGIVSLHIQNSLERMGYRVLDRVTSGEQAIEVARKAQPDVVLMDIVLQGDMDGIDTAKVIRNQYNIPIIYLTAFADEKTVKQAKLAEPFGYIIKPFEDRELRTSIEVTLFKAEIERKLRESEQRFREIFEQNFDAIILLRPIDFTVIDVNPAAEKLFGFTRDELIENFHQVFKRKRDIDTFKKAFGNLTKNDFFMDQFKFKKCDKSEIICSIKANIIRLPRENALYCSLRDITEKIKIEKEVQELQDNLQQADKMISLGILVSGVAHEINNPNNSIGLNLSVIQKAWNSILPVLEAYCKEEGDLLVGGIPYPKMKDKMPLLFSGIFECSRRIKRIVDDLKSFSGKDPNTLKMDVDINAVVRTAITLMDNLINKSTHNFQINYGKHLPILKGNFQNLEQVMINLIQNACLALETPDKSIHVTSLLDSEKGEVVVRVIDNGKGISSKDLKFVKEPFFTTRRSSGGTGLGLSVSDRIINNHGGSLKITSALGKGTTAEIRLPIITEES